MIRCREIVDPISLTVGETFYSRVTAVIFADQSFDSVKSHHVVGRRGEYQLHEPSQRLESPVLYSDFCERGPKARTGTGTNKTSEGRNICSPLQRSLAGRSALAPHQSWKHACMRDRQTYPPPHGGRGWAAAGHSFRTCALPQPSTTHAPLEVVWQPGPHPSAAPAGPMSETIAKRATIKTIFISLFSLDT
jgi:hypothetical protein